VALWSGLAPGAVASSRETAYPLFGGPRPTRPPLGLGNGPSFLGWPRLVQDDLSFWMASGDRPLRFLLQLDGDFGRGGSVYFMMNDVDLAARRFGHYEFAVQVT
jgi:hypothetical protein